MIMMIMVELLTVVKGRQKSYTVIMSVVFNSTEADNSESEPNDRDCICRISLLIIQ